MHAVILLLLLAKSIAAYKILVYNPKFGGSHVAFTGKIADILASAGHEVVVYQPILNENVTFSGTKNKNVRYYVKEKDYTFAPDFSLESTQDMLWKEESFSKMREMMAMMHRIKTGFCQLVMDDSANLEKLRKENFDLAIVEIFEACGLGVVKYLGIKRYISTFGGTVPPFLADLLGIKLTPSYIPGMMTFATDQMSFIGRLKNFVGYIPEHYFAKTMFIAGTQEVIEAKVPGFSMLDTMADSAFVFVNTDEHIEYAQPITHKIIYIGGLGKVQTAPLAKKYLDIFDSAKKGVILFSFGSVVQSAKMSDDMKRLFLEAFAEFPDINFLWKYENDEHQVAKAYKNVFTGKWLPQNDILEHPRLLAFVSHGGMNSVIEGGSKGVPMICIPVFADQKRNAKLLERRGTALILDKGKMNKDDVVAAIKKIIADPSYRENAKLVARMIKAKPMNADERIIKYSEFAAEFGDTGTLQTQGRYMTFVELYSLDVLFTLTSALILCLITNVWLIRKAVRYVKRKRSSIAKKREDVGGKVQTHGESHEDSSTSRRRKIVAGKEN
ncbi:UDP-glucoronosyl and UDP-glucosyl transferase domain-containing protein [Ditylenchus destructor]|uniref:glucuronosyltransferase n=1 Tax=Ditylenchus destructor TaxID=166010 RepID=A0AAD4NFJ2_9BILA|nr:UDP-glucoronosyl and UDP-glucosyl transferase domain-containing protein [Ditylenchus destructor]